MSLWKRFWSNPYKWGLWKWIGGRPWTFITRDVWHQLEYIPIVILFAGGYYYAVYGGDLLDLLIKFTIGYIFGHFFWGKIYIKGQQGK